MAHHDKEPYEVALKKRIISDYIRENGRSPSRAAIFELTREYKKKYINLDQVGFSAIDLEVARF